MYQGKLITDEVAAEGLLLQSQDTFPFKEHLLERCEKYNCAEILDTYVADPANSKWTPNSAIAFEQQTHLKRHWMI